MEVSRRKFLKLSGQASVFATTAMLWSHPASAIQLSQPLSGDNYKALVVITMNGGNDGNNTIVPLENAQYTAYNSIRKDVAVSKASLIPLQHASGAAPYGLHPALPTLASLYNSRRLLVAANIGPIVRPSTKEEVAAHFSLYPGGSLSHDIALSEWESGQVAKTGWGGRIADLIQSQSGSLPPVLTTAQSRFTNGNSIQAVAVQAGAVFAALPPELTTAIANMARVEQSSANLKIAATASLRSRAMASQQILNSAIAYNKLNTTFGTSPINQSLQMVARLIAGRSVVGASRQIFYMKQGSYDTHQSQLSAQYQSLADFDQAIANFLAALDEIGMRDKVLICTHSDFNRTLQPNTSGGTDHAWGNHHFIIGEGINGGRIAGSMPDMELNGAIDMNGLGCWIPTQSVTQMTAGMSRWFGLSSDQIASVFPDLSNFSAGPIDMI